MQQQQGWWATKRARARAARVMATEKEGNGESGKSNDNGDKEGNGDGKKIDGDGNKEGNGIRQRGQC